MLQDILTKITQKRLENNFSQHYMATRLNISQGYYNKIESGKKTMSLQRTLEIAAILNLDVKDLIKSNNKSA